MEAPGKVCFVNGAKGWGGGEKWYAEAPARLAARGWDVTVLAHPRGELARRLRGHSQVRTLLFPFSNLGTFNPALMLPLLALFRREGFDSVVLNSKPDLKSAGLAARWAGVRDVVLRRGSALSIKGRFPNPYLFGQVVGRVLANSEATRAALFEKAPGIFPPGRVQVVHNGIDTEPYAQAAAARPRPQAPARLELGTAGRLEHEKNHEHLLAMAVELRRLGVPFRLRLAGRGSLEERLRAERARLGLEAEVELLGFVDDMPGFMASLDLFLMTSKWEGFGFVMVEAMAAGVPVLAYDRSAMAELVRHGQNGLLVAPDDPLALARAAQALWSEPRELARMRLLAARDARERFSNEQATSQLEAFLAQARNPQGR